MMQPPPFRFAIILLLLSLAGWSAQAEQTIPFEKAYVEVTLHETPEQQPFELAGQWMMTLPAGFQRKITITKASEDTYDLRGEGQLNLAGIYEVRPNTASFVMLESNESDQPKFHWRLLNVNTLLLESETHPYGANYTGATLTRQLDWDKWKDGEVVPTVRAHR